MHTIRALVPAITEFSLVPFRKWRSTLEVGASQIIEQHIELRVEQILPAPGQVIQQRPFMLQEQIVALVEFVALGQLPKVRAQQLTHRTLLEPVPVQPKLAARRD